jgi:hypothetical protein
MNGPAVGVGRSRCSPRDFFNLDRHGIGDIHTLTVDEYLALFPWGRVRVGIVDKFAEFLR